MKRYAKIETDGSISSIDEYTYGGYADKPLPQGHGMTDITNEDAAIDIDWTYDSKTKTFSPPKG